MHNILDYLDWRGDLSFEQDALNVVDNLILSALSYLDYDGIVAFKTEEGIVTLSEVADRVIDAIDFDAGYAKNYFFRQIPELLVKASQTIRFGSIGLSCYVNRIEFEKSEQFSAIVFSLTQNQHYIAFRGTDDTLVGWKEDLQMSFMEEVRAQKDAVAYVNYIVPSLKGQLYLGGHSKGGNLAVYVAVSAEQELQDRIVAVYNNDGPGFQPKFIRRQGYRRMLTRITTIIPKTSIVGILLEHREEYAVVNSDSKGILQHNVFSWEVKGNQFVKVEGLDKSSINFNKAIKLWLNKLSLEEREQFVEELFNIIYAAGSKTVSGISTDGLSSAEGMLKAYKNMDPEARKFMRKMIAIFFGESQRVIKHSIGKNIDSIIAKRKLKAGSLKVGVKTADKINADNEEYTNNMVDVESKVNSDNTV
ncbi:MAG: Mbeg1-like protein [Mobilitalea sp.]